MIPLSLYIHFPWCVRKCPYCDFNSHQAGDDFNAATETAYLRALENDLAGDLPLVQGRPVHSIFMGGGTPSLFSADAFESLLTMLKQHLRFQDDIEITMEANPGTADYAKFSGYYQAGINRLSMGVQSFSNKQLNLLGRIHNNDDVYQAFAAARAAGFNNINLDLMHGLSGQITEQALSDLACAIQLGPEHISWYQLTIEPNTQFYKHPPQLPDEDTLWQIYTAGITLLADHGYGRYEVSAFGKPRHACKHNLNYWRFGDYLGIGAGAHGKITRDHRHLRTSKTRLPQDYLRQQKSRQKEIPQTDLAVEFLMNGLRLVEGFPITDFTERTGLPMGHLARFCTEAISKKLLEMTAERLRPTTRGMQYLNELLLLI